MTLQESGGEKDVWHPPLGLEQPLPRKVQLRQKVVYALWLAASGLVTLSLFAILLGFLSSQRTSQLSARGVHTRGTVHALMVTHGRGGIGHLVYYGFTDLHPPDAAEATQAGKADVTEAQFRKLCVGDAVDVVFLQNRPDISMLNVSLQTASRNPWRMLEFALGFILPITTVLASGFCWYYLRERRLLRWGCCVKSMVQNVWTEREGRNVVTLAKFQFVDASGLTRTGVARDIGKAHQLTAGASVRSFAVSDVATALYAPANPARSDLYPLRLVTLAHSTRD